MIEEYTLTSGDAAKILKVSRIAVHQMCDRGELHCIRLMRGSRLYRYFRLSDVTELARRRSVPVTQG